MNEHQADNMQRAVERARNQGDGDIGKTKSFVVDADATPQDDPTVELEEEGFDGYVGRKHAQTSIRRTHPSELKFSQTRRVQPDARGIGRNRVIAAALNDSRTEPYRQLRSQVLYRIRKHKLSNFAVTSAHEDAGKTLTAVNLAISIALDVNQTVLLVDLDLRSPSVHKTLSVKSELGIIDYLDGDVAVEDILLDPGYDRLLVLPGRAVDGNLSELLSSPKMKSLFRELTTRYSDRIVIFDLPPLLRNDDAMAFLPNVDACLFVVEEDVTTRSQLQRSMELLADTKLLGTVLNKDR